jgi:hypothetical protein
VNAGFINNYNKILIAALTGVLWAIDASAQTELLGISVPDAGQTATLSVSHDSAVEPMSNGSVADSVNIGVLYSPAGNGLQLRAGAWQLQSENSVPSAAAIAAPLPIDDSSLETPFTTENGMPQGVDLSASYVWESPRFGQFILSTRASYIYDFKNSEGVETAASLGGPPLLGSELQSSLTLTWQIGKHRASAVTHYADNVEPLSTLDVEELNKLVGNLTTLDLQYGYTLKAGRDGEAVISVGVRSVIDDKTGQSLHSRPAGAENSGRMAYGTIKYQF